MLHVLHLCTVQLTSGESLALLCMMTEPFSETRRAPFSCGSDESSAMTNVFGRPACPSNLSTSFRIVVQSTLVIDRKPSYKFDLLSISMQNKLAAAVSNRPKLPGMPIGEIKLG